jgi:transposase
MITARKMAGSCWQLTALGVKCDVVAPTLIPVKAGDRVKTDGIDALKLAHNHRNGDLTAVWVPDEAHEALRDLVRARRRRSRISCGNHASAAAAPADSTGNCGLMIW